MFEQSLIHERSRGPRGWALGGSLLAQGALVALLVLFPLLSTYRLPEHVWRDTLTWLAPPPPPAPLPPPAVKVEPQPPTERFDNVLMQPTRVPDKVALIDEAPERLALSAAPDGLPGGVVGGVAGTPSLLPFLPPAMSRPIRVGGSVQAARILHRVTPVYPPEAIAERIGGIVLLEAIIDRQGAIREVVLKQGHPLLAAAAIDAVRQWSYKPTVLNGAPVEVQTFVEVNFNLLLPPPEEEPAATKPGTRRRRAR